MAGIQSGLWAGNNIEPISIIANLTEGSAVIHTDFEEGSIRTEAIAYDTPSLAKVSKAGEQEVCDQRMVM